MLRINTTPLTPEKNRLPGSGTEIVKLPLSLKGPRASTANAIELMVPLSLTEA